MLWDVWVMTLLPLFSAAARTRVVTPKRFGFVDNCGFLEAGEGGHEITGRSLRNNWLWVVSSEIRMSSEE